MRGTHHEGKARPLRTIGVAATLLIIGLGTERLGAAPVPAHADAKVLVAALSDPDEKVREQSTIALRGRPDALPWLRRAARSSNRDTTRRATLLITIANGKRLETVEAALESSIKNHSADLFVEWHHFWEPKSKEKLWPVGPRMGKPALALAAKLPHEGEGSFLEQQIAAHRSEHVPHRYSDGPFQTDYSGGTWTVRTDRLGGFRADVVFGFASVLGPTYTYRLRGCYFYTLGTVQATELYAACVLADAEVSALQQAYGLRSQMSVHGSVLVSRSNFTAGSTVCGSVILVDGDIDLTRTHDCKNNIIRATGEIRLPKSEKPVNCTIESRAKNATAPYKFFELSDVGLSLADDEEGLVVTGVKADTPFGNCGLAKGDLIRFIDDVPAGHSEEFRKTVRRALVRQGDCLVTVVRGDKTLDLPVFFPLPK